MTSVKYPEERPISLENARPLSCRLANSGLRISAKLRGTPQTSGLVLALHLLLDARCRATIVSLTRSLAHRAMWSMKDMNAPLLVRLNPAPHYRCLSVVLRNFHLRKCRRSGRRSRRINKDRRQLKIAIRYFEVADRFQGTPQSLRAQRLSLDALQKDMLQDICEAAIEAHLDRLRGEHRTALKEHGGKFPTSKPTKNPRSKS